MSAHKFKGFGALKTPIDLLGKIRFDFKRLQDSPDDTYAAFDFFVSAYHMLDWLHPPQHKYDKAAKKAIEAEESNSPLLQICSHLANGVKHFEATATKHESVSGVDTEGDWVQRDMVQLNAFQVGGLVVRLDGQAASLFGQKISAIDLAIKVLAHWEADPRLK